MSNPVNNPVSGQTLLNELSGQADQNYADGLAMIKLQQKNNKQNQETAGRSNIEAKNNEAMMSVIGNLK